MAIAVASLATGSYGSGNPSYTTTITKPTGLAVGDLMVAFINGTNGTSGSPSTVPSGFTLGRSQAYGFGTRNNFSTYYKIAASGDVAASNFTWGNSVTGGGSIGGTLFRITGALANIDQSTSNDAGNTSSPAIGPITPTYPNSLLLFGVATDATSGSVAVGSYAIATSNPTWTEQVDTQTSTFAHAIASAIRPEITDTGNWTATISGGGTYYVGMQTMSIAAIVDQAISPTFVSAAYEVVAPTIQQGQTASPTVLGATLSVVSPAVKKSATWTNQSENAGSWTNQTKS